MKRKKTSKKEKVSSTTSLDQENENLNVQSSQRKAPIVAKPHKRALFDLVKLYEEGSSDKVKTYEMAVDLLQQDPACVQRQFWEASIEYEELSDEEVYDNEIGTFADIEGMATPLWIAAGNGPVEVVKLLLEHGADPNETWNIDCCVVSAVHHAILFGRLDCVKLLVEYGANVEKSYDLELGNMANVAAVGGHVEILNLLTGLGIGPVEDKRVKRRLGMVAVHEKLTDGSTPSAETLKNPLMISAIKENQKKCTAEY